jgi:hypothetical protein
VGETVSQGATRAGGDGPSRQVTSSATSIGGPALSMTTVVIDIQPAPMLTSPMSRADSAILAAAAMRGRWPVKVGTCVSSIEEVAEGRLRLREHWRWDGQPDSHWSVLDEV